MQALPPPITIASPQYFTSPEATATLDRAVVSALIRLGETSTVEAMHKVSLPWLPSLVPGLVRRLTDSTCLPRLQNSSDSVPTQVVQKAQMLHSILRSMKVGDLQPALQ